MAVWTLRTAIPATDYPRLVEIYNAVNTHPATVDDFLQIDEQRSRSGPALRLLLEDESGFAAAFGGLTVDAWRAAGTFNLQVTVAPAAAGQGLGTRLYEALEAEAVGHGAQLLTTVVRDDVPAWLAWAQKKGYGITNHYFKSDLRLADFDPAPFREAVTRAEAEGYRFFTLDQVEDLAAGQRRLYELDMDAAWDEPGIDRTKWPPITFDEYAAQIFQPPRFDPRAVVVAERAGEWAGLTGLHYRPQDNSGWVFFTGVRQAHRGRGLAQALKLLSIQFAKGAGWERVGTSNNARNPAMLAVNQKLGFKSQPGIYVMEKPL